MSPLAMLYRWRQRLAETVAGRVAGPRAKVPARVTRKVAPFAAVRIRPVPVTEAALRIVLPNGTLPADRRHTAPRRGCPLKPNRCEVTEADKYVAAESVVHGPCSVKHPLLCLRTQVVFKRGMNNLNREPTVRCNPFRHGIRRTV